MPHHEPVNCQDTAMDERTAHLDRVTATWQEDASVRAEFRSFAAYEAYVRRTGDSASRRSSAVADAGNLADQIEAEWASSPALQAEFGSFADYAAYRRSLTRAGAPAAKSST